MCEIRPLAVSYHEASIEEEWEARMLLCLYLEAGGLRQGKYVSHFCATYCVTFIWAFAPVLRYAAFTFLYILWTETYKEEKKNNQAQILTTQAEILPSHLERGIVETVF